MAIAPWQMWGERAVLDVPNQGDFTPGQLCRVNYGRPETWTFLFGVRLLAGPNVAAGVPPLVTIAFDVITGLGRSRIEIIDRFAGVTGFANFDIGWTLGVAAPAGKLKWCTSVPAPPMKDSEAPPGTTPLVDHFPGQDIQITARCGFQGGAGPLTARVELFAFLAPRSHVRPEWSMHAPDKIKFRGNEAGGT